MHTLKKIFQDRPHLYNKICIVSFWPGIIYKVCISFQFSMIIIIIIHTGRAIIIEHGVFVHTGTEYGS